MGHTYGLSPSRASMMLGLILVVVIGPAQAALTPLVHMINHCYKDIYVNDSLVLDLTENLQADRVMVGHLSCAVTLHAPSDARVYLHVLQLAISDHLQTPDRLHIYDVSKNGKDDKRLTPSTGLYGVLERPFLVYNTAGIIVPDFRSSGSRMRLDYQGKPTVIYRGFRVLVTVFYNPDEKGRCRPDTWHCPYAGTCVPFSVRCDEFPNCGLDDNNDEKSCQREYVVSDVLDEYSTRTAVIAAVAGIVIFLGVAAIVLVVVLKYTRKKYGRGADQSARYTSRGDGGDARSKNEEDLARLYAPPSYEDVMTPQDHDQALLPRCGHRHCGPPPAYSTVAAALIHHEEGGVSSEEDVSHKRPSALWSSAHPTCQPPPPSSHKQRSRGPRERVGAAEEAEEGDEDVRMHGTWPSDTDEEEEVRARRRKKGGKCKGKSKSSSKPENSAAAAAAADTAAHAAPVSNSKTERIPKSRVGERLGWSDVPSDASGSGGAGSGSGAEVVSETESQLLAVSGGGGSSGKRNSRTESNSPDSSSTSSYPGSPAKQPSPARGEGEGEGGGSQKNSETTSDFRDLHRSDSPSSIHAHSPSVTLQGKKKLSSDPPSDDAVLQKGQDPDQSNVDREGGFVDLNPSRTVST